VARGFYSVVQYCPDRFRAEAVNVGLVLLCLDPHAVRVRMSSNHDRVKKLFTIAKPELQNLKLSTHGLASRIETSVGELRTVEDLAAFAASRANDLRLTEPRLAKLEDIDADFERLFSQLVYQPERYSAAARAVASPAEVLPPGLGEVFHRLSQQRKIWDPEPIRVPVSKRKLDVPYAFRNGVVNLVKPHVFNPGKRAETEAAKLAIDGDLISRHPIDGERHKLIVVSPYENDRQAREVTEHIEPLFREYNVRLIRPHDADAFAQEVEQTAH
jgi:hypothetical protein